MHSISVHCILIIVITNLNMNFFKTEILLPYLSRLSHEEKHENGLQDWGD